jgi:hypothetical protein
MFQSKKYIQKNNTMSVVILGILKRCGNRYGANAFRGHRGAATGVSFFPTGTNARFAIECEQAVVAEQSAVRASEVAMQEQMRTEEENRCGFEFTCWMLCRCEVAQYRCSLNNTKSRKQVVTDAFGEFHTDINDNTSGINYINASYSLFFRLSLSDGRLRSQRCEETVWLCIEHTQLFGLKWSILAL